MKNKTKRRIAKNLEIGKKQAAARVARRKGTFFERVDGINERCRATEGEGVQSEHVYQPDLEIVRE